MIWIELDMIVSNGLIATFMEGFQTLTKVCLCLHVQSFAHARHHWQPDYDIYCSIFMLFYAPKFVGASPNSDQLWGVLSRRLGRSSCMVDADSARTIIEEELSKSSLQKWINGKVIVHILRQYRDWKTHVEKHAPVSFEPRL